MLQPSEIDQPERLGQWLRDAGATLTVLRPSVEAVPTPSEVAAEYDAVVCLGGEMNALDDTGYPWLVAVRALLADAVDRGVAVLGVCLGAQLLGAATGGGVRIGEAGPEVGPMLVAKRDVAEQDPLFGPLPLTPLVVQFHHDEVAPLPPGATLLASSSRYPHQAYRIGLRGYGVQFHIETTPGTVTDWARNDETAAAQLAPGALDPAQLAAAHDEIAEVWAPFATRFVALAAGELMAAEVRTLPLLG